MKTISGVRALQKILNPLRGRKTIGLVPTMGAFHEGHLSLMRRAKRECDCVIVSLFVNPLQFGPQEDFKSYPRNLAADREMARSAGADLLWTPSSDEMYPSAYQTFVEVERLARRWEGAVRPGHFRGVATVVAKLFQVVRPDRAYFGGKDYQQTRVIRQMVRDLHFDVKLKILPTVREKDGLAMSSRNRRLAPEERKIAPILYQSLQRAENKVRQGKRESRAIIQPAESLLESEPSVRIDYIALCDPETLEPIDRLTKKGILLLAAKIGGVRLIDNLLVGID